MQCILPGEDACRRRGHGAREDVRRLEHTRRRLRDSHLAPAKGWEARCGFVEGARLHRELPWQNVNTRWRFPRAPPASGGQFQWRTRIGKFLGLAPRSPLAKRQHARAISQRRCRRAAGDSSCELAKARCDFVEGRRWHHRELPAQNANARRRFPKGIAEEWRDISAARADVPTLGKCGANLLKACAPASQKSQIPIRFLHSLSGQGGNVAVRAGFQGLPANIQMSILVIRLKSHRVHMSVREIEARQFDRKVRRASAPRDAP